MSKLNAWIPSLALAFGAAAFGISGYDHLNMAANSNVNKTDLVTKVIPTVVTVGLMGKHPITGEEIQMGVGSGFIIDGKNGYIVTNHHVAGDGKADKIIVTLQGNKRYVATLIGTDEQTDISVLQIKPDKALPQVTFGNSDNVHSGDTVVAIGSPMGMSNSVSSGIVSTPARDIGNQVQRLIQHDASINPGNSGGPLFNSKGEIIGVNEMILSKSGGFDGISMSIPSNMAKIVANIIIAKGSVKWGYLGVTMKMVKEGPIASADELDLPRNIRIESVAPDSPAEKAGLKAGDIITSVNGKAAKDSSSVSAEVPTMMAGAMPEIGYLRDGKNGSVKVTLAERPKAAPKAHGEEAKPDDNDDNQDAPKGLPMPKATPKEPQTPAPEGVPMPHATPKAATPH